MSACIFLFGLFFSIVTNFQNITKNVAEGITITVYFTEGISQEGINKVGEEIDKRVEVSKKEFVSAEQAWEKFSGDYFGDLKEDLADGFKDNPLINSSHYVVYMNDVSMQASLVSYLESLAEVREVKRADTAANTVTDFSRLLGWVSIGIIIILLFVAVFLISTTITTGIAVRKEEIAIMKLIGATDYIVRAPFIVEGILIGLVGSAIPLLLLFVLYNRLIVYIMEKFRWLNNILSFLPVERVFSTLVPVGLLLGVGIGFLGSRLTIWKHLKV
jgi:cell division transport system permease protein